MQLAISRKYKKALVVALCSTLAVAVAGAVYVKTHPLVFNESFFEHAHCIVITGLAFPSYAGDHDGRFPADTNGYGNALLLLTNYVNDFWAGLTGPGYDGKVFADAAKTGQHLPEVECGRVYVQGLSDTNNPEIALFFDKIPTPGGDHCHGIRRISAPLAREVWTVGCDHLLISESDWPAFSKKQIDLLVSAGIPRAHAEEYYSQGGKH